MKKLIYSALAASAAFAVAFGGSAVNVSADETPTPAPVAQSVLAGDSVSYEISGDTLTISGSDASKILVGTAKLKKDAFTTAAWDVYDNDGSVEVDLSKIAKTKDAYLQVKADFETDAQAYTLKIPASDVIKGKYDKKTGTLSVLDPKNAYTGAVNFRTETQFGVQPLTSLDLSKYQMTGGVIYISTAQTAVTKAADEKADKVLDKRPSKEAKVAIGKLANAPKVKANYVAGTITVPKGADYWNYKSGEAVPATKSAVDKAVVLTLGTDIDASANFAVDVQAQAVPTKKLASKLGHNVFAAQTATTVGSLGELAVDAKGKGTIENKSSTESYVIYWWADGKTDISTADLKKKNTKKTTVKPGKTATLAKVASAAGIAVQRVGVSKKGEEAWAGTIVQFLEGPNVEAYTAGESGGSGGSTTPTVTKYAVTITGSNSMFGLELDGDATSFAENEDVKVNITGGMAGNSMVPTMLPSSVEITYGDSSTITLTADNFASDNKSFTFKMPAGATTITIK